MHYSDYELLSGRSESRLADLLSEKVNEYINDQHSALRRLQRDLEEVTAERDDMADELRRLRREMEELRQHHAMSTKAMNFSNKVGTVVAHADHVTLQYLDAV